MGAFGLMYYRARWYDPALGRFAQADTVVPGTGEVLAWDRYAYTLNNPVKFSDPSGHWACGDDYDPACSEDKFEAYEYFRATGDKSHLDRFFILTDEIILKGGPGTDTSYEDNYTGYSLSGEAPLAVYPFYEIPGVLSDLLVWARDRTNLLDWLHTKWPDVFGTSGYALIAYEKIPKAGYILTDISYVNYSYVETTSVINVTVLDKNNHLALVPFPVRSSNACTPDAAIVPPRQVSPLVPIRPVFVPIGIGYQINIYLTTDMGRYGVITYSR